MNRIGRCSAYIGLVALAFSGAPSQATLVTYDFTASVSSMFEYAALTQGITYLSQSVLPGTLVSVGDAISGRFSYDTDAPLSPYYQPPAPASGSYQLYQSAAGGSQSTTFAMANGLTYSSIGSPIIQVANDAPTFGGWDILSVSTTTGQNPALFQIASINLFDQSASVFQDSSIPSSLGLADFHYKSLNTAWVRQSDGNQLQVMAGITSLSLFTVPEPKGYQLLLAGLLALGLVCRNGAVRGSLRR